jgi:hypothetical protein
VRADDRYVNGNGTSSDREGRRQATRAVRETLLDMSVSLEELLPILEAARSLEAALRSTLLSLGSAPSDLPTRVGDYVPQPAAAVPEVRDDTPPAPEPALAVAGAAVPAHAEVSPPASGYLVNLDEDVPRPDAPADVDGLHAIAVIISGPRGPVDLARVHAALDSMDGVANLRLGRYDRSGVVIYVETARSPSDLPIQQALSSVFAEGVTGRWATPDEYLATVGAA